MGASPHRSVSAHDAPSEPLPAERREIIQDRLASGFYRQPDVLLQTAERLLTDLLSDEPLDDSTEPEASDHRER